MLPVFSNCVESDAVFKYPVYQGLRFLWAVQHVDKLQVTIKRHFWFVVYFDQQTHAFAHAFARAFAWSKMIKNIRKSWKKSLFHHTHERLTKKKVCWSAIESDSQSLVDAFLIIFLCFWSFLTVRTHAQACVRWSKYTTLVCLCNIEIC